MAVIRFACPACQSVLKSSNPIALGTKIRCPKCSHIFPLTREAREAALAEETVPTPPRKGPASDEYAELDDTDGADDWEEEREEKPRPRLKNKKRKTTSNTALILGLSIGGLLLLSAGAGAGLWFWLRTPNFQEPLAFVPANSSMIMSFDIENLMDQFGVTSQQLEKVFGQDKEGPDIAKCKEETGLEVKELFSQVVLATNAPLQQVATPDSKFVVIVKSKVPFDQKKVLKFFKADDSPQKLAGKTYYKGKSRRGEEGVTFIPSKYLIVGTNLKDKELEALLTADGNKTAPSADLMAMVNTVRPSPLWLVALYDPALSQDLQNGAGAGGAAAPGADNKVLLDAMAGAKAFGLWAAVENNQVNMHGGLMCRDARGASQVTSEMQKAWDKETKGVVAAGKIALGLMMLPKPMQDTAKELMANVKFTSRDTLAQVSTHASLQSIKNTVQGLQGMVGGMMGGGMPAGSGAPPGFGPPGNVPRPNNPGLARPGGPARGGRGAAVPGRSGK